MGRVGKNAIKTKAVRKKSWIDDDGVIEEAESKGEVTGAVGFSCLRLDVKLLNGIQ